MDPIAAPSRYQLMMNAQGFRDLVNAHYQAALKEDPLACRLDSFDELNEEYRRFSSRYRYIDYDCFTAAERRARKDAKERAKLHSQRKILTESLLKTPKTT